MIIIVVRSASCFADFDWTQIYKKISNCKAPVNIKCKNL